jgi:hypothetical protein
MKTNLILFWPFLFSFLIVTRHDKAADAFYANQEDYSHVVQMQLSDATEIVEMEGTFIQNDWIITAVHGLTSVEENQPIALFDTTFTITRIVMHPDFEGLENDIALIQLDREAEGIEPASLYTESEETGTEITIMGRGWYGTGESGPVTDDKTFRLGTNKIDSVSTHWIKFRFDEPDHPNTTELESISGPGDSGGPAFINYDGRNYLAGISSNQMNEQLGILEGHYGVIEYYTRVSSYIPWIDKVLSGDYETPVESGISSLNNEWNFPDSQIGEKATLLMDAIVAKEITDSIMEKVFYKDFRESFDLKGFVQGIANNLVNPTMEEISRARRNVLIFTIRSNETVYYLQLEADRRDDYQIGGLIFKKLDD